MGASDIRARLNDLHSYLLLAFALKCGADPRLEEFRHLLRDVGDFIRAAGSRELKSRGKELVTSLTRAVEVHAQLLPRRQSVMKIASDFRELARESNVWRYGVSYGWLCERFVPEAIPHPLDLPPHARVGIGAHSGNASVEELFLLEDAFLLFARGEELYEKLRSRADDLKASSSRDQQQAYRALSQMNAEVGTYARLAVVSAAAFLEAFVNSVGWTEALRGSRKADQVDLLRGKRNDRYLSLEWKLERFPKLIRSDGTSPIVLSDERQIKEPFKTFLSVTKEVRDASMHYSPGKADIWLPPGDWVVRAETAIKSAVGVAASFWEACYPARTLPDYLDHLEYGFFLERAQRRVRETTDPDRASTPA